jgi:hypothetical protein
MALICASFFLTLRSRDLRGFGQCVLGQPLPAFLVRLLHRLRVPRLATKQGLDPADLAISWRKTVLMDLVRVSRARDH